MFSKFSALFSEHTMAAVIRLVGVIITAICTLVGVILTGYFMIKAEVAPVERSIEATRTAEAELVMHPAPTSDSDVMPLPTDTIGPTDTSAANGSPPTTPVPPNNTPTPRNKLEVLSGVWQVSRQNQYGSSLEYWDIKADTNQITIEAFKQSVSGVPLPGDYRKNLPVSDFEFDGQKLAFTITGSVAGITEQFDLTLIGTDRIEGVFTSNDTYLSDTGIIQGEPGVIETTGRAILIRQSR